LISTLTTVYVAPQEAVRLFGERGPIGRAVGRDREPPVQLAAAAREPVRRIHAGKLQVASAWGLGADAPLLF
jgi:hypothetical protein